MKLFSDKLLHFLVSYALTVTGALFMPLWLAALVVVLIGASKEWYDKKSGKGSAERADLVADIVGIIVAVLAILSAELFR